MSQASSGEHWPATSPARRRVSSEQHNLHRPRPSSVHASSFSPHPVRYRYVRYIYILFLTSVVTLIGMFASTNDGGRVANAMRHLKTAASPPRRQAPRPAAEDKLYDGRMRAPPVKPDFPPFSDFVALEELHELTMQGSSTSARRSTGLPDERGFEERHFDRLAHCGAWPRRYARMHAAALDDAHRPKLVVAARKVMNGDGTMDSGGYADRMKGIVTVFAVALALDVPFFIHWNDDDPLPAEAITMSPHINWMWQGRLLQQHDTELFWGWRMAGHQQDAPPTLARDLVNWSREELLRLAISKPINVWQTNIGSVTTVLESDSWLGGRLRELGLNAGTAYECILNYLFEPLPQTRAVIDHFAEVIQHPSIFSVALQIRNRDLILSDGFHDVWNAEYYRHYFECAADIVRARATHQHRHAVFVILSDNKDLRAAVASNMSEFLPSWSHPTLPLPVPLVAPIRPKHIGLDSNDNVPPEARQQAFQSTVVENHYMDYTSARVITEHSGYGILSALRTWNTISRGTTFEVRRPGPGRQRAVTIDNMRCDEEGADISFQDLYSQHGFG